MLIVSLALYIETFVTPEQDILATLKCGTDSHPKKMLVLQWSDWLYIAWRYFKTSHGSHKICESHKRFTTSKTAVGTSIVFQVLNVKGHFIYHFFIFKTPLNKRLKEIHFLAWPQIDSVQFGRLFYVDNSDFYNSDTIKSFRT